MEASASLPAAPGLAPLSQLVGLLLRIARLLLENGAETRRTFETVQQMGRSLGVEELHVLVTHRSVMMTGTRGEEHITRIIRVNTLSVNFTMVSGISRLLKRYQRGELSLAKVESELQRLTAMPPHYPRWLVITMVGLACGGFSLLFEGDWQAFVACVVAASLGLFVRQELHHRAFQPLLYFFATALVSSFVANLLARLLDSSNPNAALVASVLMLVPGVPMINSVADLVKGHLLTGIARATTVVLITFAVALGLLASMYLGGFTKY
ncbi:MAG: threonine/serine exporter family protein [Verrucomicrobiota bacterium JB022]|nr:threonine/serine exporter family protein [Verrucomicrobiota bacterium JB022]